MLVQAIISTNGMESYVVFLYENPFLYSVSFIMREAVISEDGTLATIFVEESEAENHLHRIDKAPEPSKF